MMAPLTTSDTSPFLVARLARQFYGVSMGLAASKRLSSPVHYVFPVVSVIQGRVPGHAAAVLGGGGGGGVVVVVAFHVLRWE